MPRLSRRSPNAPHRLAGCVLILVVTIAITGAACSGTDANSSSTSSPTAPTTTSSAVPGERRVSTGGLSISVPSDWAVAAPAPGKECPDVRSPAVVVGTFDLVRNCFVTTSSLYDLEVTFGSGGPPEPPIVSGPTLERTINGVRALVATGPMRVGGDESQVLASFPDWEAWLQVTGATSGSTAATAVAEQLLGTLALTDPDASPPARLARESFVGHWHVHGGQLEIGRDTATQTSAYTSCDLPVVCLEVDTMSLGLSSDGRLLSAIVKAISYVGASGEPLRDAPVTSAPSSAIGDASYFEFAAPHLLRETFVSGIGTSESTNPYWCGDNLATIYSDHCGA